VNTRAGRQTATVVLVAIALVVGIVVAGTNKSGGSTAPKGEVFLDAANSPGTNAFTPSVASAFAVGQATTTTTTPPASTAPGAVSSISGATVGLYGGTLNLSSCNAQQMIGYLNANPSLGRAWAAAEGIPYGGLATYIDTLTPVILRGDTQVTNHGYINGVANPIPEILQAGTAVLVDSYGVPRARCYCGNPLTPPIPTTVAPRYVGPRWQTFSPATVVVVVPAPAPISTFTLVDTNTGRTFTRPAGTRGSADSPSGSAGGSSTTSTLPPGLNAGGTLYTLSLSNAHLLAHVPGSSFTSADCASALVSSTFNTYAHIVTSGTQMAMTFSNVLLLGPYDPSSGRFKVSGAVGVGQNGTAVPAMIGTLGPNSITNGQFAEIVTPPGVTCTYSMSGRRVLVP